MKLKCINKKIKLKQIKMNKLIYIDNNPIKPVIYIGVIFFSFNKNDKKIRFLLKENNICKYEDIGLNIDSINDSLNDSINDSINDAIINSLQFHTNYLIDFDRTDLEKLNNIYSKDIYIPSEMALIKFISSPDIITNLKSEDFGLYTFVSNDEKIKRTIKWVEKEYLFRVLNRFNKLSKKINNKEVLDTIRLVESEIKMNNILKSIKNVILKK